MPQLELHRVSRRREAWERLKSDGIRDSLSPEKAAGLLRAWKASPVEERHREEEEEADLEGPWARSDSLGGRCYRSVLLEI